MARRGPTAVVLALAMGVAGCGGGSADDGHATPAVSHAAASATATPTATASPSTLGDGEVIVFERLVPGQEDRDLYAVSPGGGEPRLLRTAASYPHWSRDGSMLAFTGCLNPPDCTTGLALLERSTGQVRGFAMPDPDLFTSCAIWAPSGRALACEGNSDDQTRNGIYTVRASDGGGLTRLTRSPGGDYPLTYSPDGRLLLLDRGRGDGPDRHALFVVPARGGRPHRITPWGYTDDYASWSPDGRAIVFGTNGALYRVGPDGTGLAEIRVETVDGRRLTHAFDVAFSPDGQRIVFSVAGAEPGLYLAAPDGSAAALLTTSPTEDHHASWGPAASSS